MCPHKSPGRLLESVSDYRSRWIVISLAIARQNPAYRATLLYFVYIALKGVRDMRKYLVEVFARVRVILRKFTVNFAVMRAHLRAKLMIYLAA